MIADTLALADTDALIAEGWFHIMFKNIFLYLIIKENLPLVGAHVHAACLDSPDQATSIYCMHMPTYM
jgi:hypothetical protein